MGIRDREGEGTDLVRSRSSEMSPATNTTNTTTNSMNDGTTSSKTSDIPEGIGTGTATTGSTRIAT